MMADVPITTCVQCNSGRLEKPLQGPRSAAAMSPRSLTNANVTDNLMQFGLALLRAAHMYFTAAGTNF